MDAIVRPTWEQTWMEVAHVVSRRSRCVRRAVGAVIVSYDNRIVATGYNGPPAMFKPANEDPCSDWCPRATGEQTKSYDNCVSVHAELNAIAYADRSTVVGGALFVTSSVCWDCGKVIANSGISTVYMAVDWTADAHREVEKTINFLDACGLTVIIARETR